MKIIYVVVASILSLPLFCLLVWYLYDLLRNPELRDRFFDNPKANLRWLPGLIVWIPVWIYLIRYYSSCN